MAIAFGRSYAAMGSNNVYAAVQQLGGQAGRGHRTRIPARPYLPVTAGGELAPGAERDVLEIIVQREIEARKRSAAAILSWLCRRQ